MNDAAVEQEEQEFPERQNNLKLWRDQIAQAMWDDYVIHLRNRGY